MGAKAPTIEELWQLIQEQRVQTREQQAQNAALTTEVAALKARLDGQEVRQPARGSVPTPPRHVPRAGLLKVAAATAAGLTGAGLAGSQGASPVAAASDTSFTATGG